MSDTHETPHVPRPSRETEYEDPHYHDDELHELPDDQEARQALPPRFRKPTRKLPTRRRYEED